MNNFVPLLLMLIFALSSCSGSSFTSGASGNRSAKRPATYSQTGEVPVSDSTAIEDNGNSIQACAGLTKLGVAGITKTTPNIVPNGDFESSNTDIIGDYVFDDLKSCVDSDSLRPGVGKYSIVTNPNKCHRAWDVITSESKIAIFNGAVGSKFWCKTFSVEAGKSYAFSVDERLLHPDMGAGSKNGSSPLRWTINGTNVLEPVSPGQQWRTRGVLWSSQSTSQVELCGQNGSANNSGNDWGIDNICLVAQ